MWRFVVVTALLLAVCYGERLSSPSFRNFMSKYKKSYESEEEHNNRYWIFHRNMLQWEEMNRNELGTATYGMNKFADLSPEEFRSRYLSNYSISQLDQARYSAKKAVKSNVADMPDAVDWREKNAVTPVKDQGQCGSCWAFSTVANIEGRWAIKTGDLISLSEQEIVDCDEVNYGCDGGYPWEADKEISRLGGLVREESYEYTAVAGECKLNVSQVVVQVEGSEFLSRVEKEIAAHVAENGPVSALLNAKAMMWYEGGVSHPKVCKASGIDHAITIVGFGMDKKQPYWLIKNSWSTDWGENGYYRLYRGKRVCGINSWATTVVL